MIRRPFLGMAAGFLFGIFCVSAGRAECYVLMLVSLLCFAGAYLFGFHVRSNRRAAFRILMIAVMQILGGWRYENEAQILDHCLRGMDDGMEIRVLGKLTAKEYKNNQYIYYLSSSRMGKNLKESGAPADKCRSVAACLNADAGKVGEIILLEGKIKLWKPAVNEGGFDERAYYHSKQIYFKVEGAKILSVSGTEDRFMTALSELSLKLSAVYQSCLSTKDAGIMTTMLLGDKSLLDSEVKNLYQSAGILHALTISGLHLTVIGMSVYRLLRKKKAGFLISGIAAGFLVYGYAQMTGMGISVRRAAGMFLLSVAAQAIGRSYDSLNALGAVTVFLLWSQPFLIYYAGFLFSLAAVLGVVGIRVCSVKEGIPEKVFHGFAIQLTTLPFAAWYYFEVPVYAVGINLLLLPLLPPLLLFGIAGGAAGLVSGLAAKALLMPCHLILSVFFQICSFSAGLPAAVLITGKPTVFRMFCYFALLFFWNQLRIRSRKKRQNRTCENRVQTCRRYTDFGRDLLAGVLLLVFLFFPAGVRAEMDLLDVGQGDAVFIRSAQGYQLFIDGGSSDVKKVGEYRILPFLKSKGAANIDYWFVSHADNDHISGLKELILLKYPISHLVFYRDILKDDAFLELYSLAHDAGVKILYMKQGDILHIGNAAFYALFPDWPSGERNDDSLCLWYEEDGFSAVFTGDIGNSGERRLLAHTLPERVEFYKAGHHGSDGSNSSELLSVLSPAVTGVSCGKKNRYGHPGRNAIAHMEEAGSHIFCTMESGQICLIWEKEKVWVRSCLQPLDVYCFPVVY